MSIELFALLLLTFSVGVYVGAVVGWWRGFLNGSGISRSSRRVSREWLTELRRGEGR